MAEKWLSFHGVPKELQISSDDMSLDALSDSASMSCFTIYQKLFLYKDSIECILASKQKIFIFTNADYKTKCGSVCMVNDTNQFELIVGKFFSHLL